MDITLKPCKLSGVISAIPSKSQAHRVMICAAFADAPTKMICPKTNDDIEATADCLRALGAEILAEEYGYLVVPVKKIPAHAQLHCRESGSTLRFLLPVVAALGVCTDFIMEGRLPQRPLSPLWEELERNGCRLRRIGDNILRCSGKLQSGSYRISGNVSSQFITGFLLALPLMEHPGTLEITGDLQSKPYVDLTLQVLSMFRISCVKRRSVYSFYTNKPLTPQVIEIEGDWSNGAFFIAAKHLGSALEITGLNAQSVQGDRKILDILDSTSFPWKIDGSDIPDLIPVLAVTAGACGGAVFTGIHRLRLKESDRIQSILNLISAIGGKASAEEDVLTVEASAYQGGCVDSAGDHRIAMAAAVAATVSSHPITICGGECVSKSYPGFWEDYKSLGGMI